MTANRAWDSYLMASTIEHQRDLSHIHVKPFLERQPTPDPHIGQAWVRLMPGPKSYAKLEGLIRKGEPPQEKGCGLGRSNESTQTLGPSFWC